MQKKNNIFYKTNELLIYKKLFIQKNQKQSIFSKKKSKIFFKKQKNLFII